MGLSELISYLVRVFDAIEIEYFITGSTASIFYGEPRFTNDIDVVAAIDHAHIEKLLCAFPPENFYLSEDAIRDAIQHNYQFNIIHPSSGLKIDVMIRKETAFDDSRFLRRRRVMPMENLTAYLSSPEDIIIKKMEYYKQGGSEKHIRDILSMFKISGDMIDAGYITLWAEKLALQEIWSKAQAMLGISH